MSATRLGVIDQIQISMKPKNRLPLAAGFLLGGFVPVASYTVAHQEVATNPILWLLVVGGLAYSATTIFQWAKIAFRHAVKALGFVVLLEGVMTFSHVSWLGYAALGFLLAINGIATGSNLVADRKLSRR